MKKGLYRIVGMMFAGSMIVYTGCGMRQDTESPKTIQQEVQTAEDTPPKSEQETKQDGAVSSTTYKGEDDSKEERQAETEDESFQKAVEERNLKPSEREYLAILDEVSSKVQIGASEDDLNTIQATVTLMNWGVGTTLTEQEIKKNTAEWLMTKKEEERISFRQKMKQVDKVYQSLLTEGQEDLLIKAGCQDAPYPWSDAPLEPIEALMLEIGQR